MTQRFKNLTTWSKTLVFLWFFIFLTSNMPGVLEGKFYPVITDMNVVIASEFPMTSITGTYNKNRICDLEEIRWYIVGANGHKIRIKTNDIPIDERFFATGIQTFGPIEAKFPATFLMNNSEVDIVSNCHPLWYTITSVYP